MRGDAFPATPRQALGAICRPVKRALKWGLWRLDPLDLLERVLRKPAGQPSLLILTYHHVTGKGSDLDETPFERGVSVEEFERQVRELASNWRVMELSDAVGRMVAGKPLPKRALCLTFDDGYMDVHTYAFPVLRHHSVPATVFVSSGFVGSDAVPWWSQMSHLFMSTQAPAVDLDHLPGANGQITAASGPLLLTRDQHRFKAIATVNEVMKELPSPRQSELLAELSDRLGLHAPAHLAGTWLGWAQMIEMSRHGVAIGSHTIHHPNLTLLDRQEQEAEIVGAKHQLQEGLGTDVDLFSYPFGLLNATSREIVAKEFAAACGSVHGANQWPPDQFSLRRISIGWHRIWDFSFALKLPEGRFTGQSGGT